MLIPQFSPPQSDSFAFTGGLFQNTPALSVPAGSLINCLNYELDVNRGYRRVRGYEPIDGRPRPSDAVPTAVAATLSLSAVVAGNVLTIGAVTCVYVKAVTGGLLVLDASGPIPVATTIMLAGAPIGTTGTPSALSYSATAAQEAQDRFDAAEVRRALIAAVPGAGDIRGVVLFAGTLYAWRDNSDATAGVMHQATATGWTPVALAEEVVFSNANAAVGEGDTLTQGAVTATVARVIVETGTLASGANTGRLVITARNGGNLTAAAATSTGGGTLTLAGAQTAQAFPAGGKYRFDQYNFFGNTAAFRLYGCNGVGPAFEFDGTTLAFIRSDPAAASTDTPSFIRANRKYLYLAKRSSVVNSSVGEPQRYVASEGAAETGVGGDVTALFILPGEALGIATRNTTQAIIGASAATWSLQTVSLDTGAAPDTVQPLGAVYALDDRGVIRISTSQNFGNFDAFTVSRQIQTLIDSFHGKAVDSCVVRTRNLYRVFMNTKQVLSGMPVKGGMAFGLLELLHQPTTVWSGEDTDGTERVFFGATDGFVYEMERGSSFAGQPIESAIRVWYWHSRSPRVEKHYKRAALEVSSDLFSAVQAQHELTFGDPNAAMSSVATISAAGGGGIWDLSNWNEFFWNAQDVSQPVIDLGGDGVNLSLIFYANTALDFSHVLQGATIEFNSRRRARA